MSDDLLNIGYLEWADDGKIIYFSNIIPGEIYSSFVHYFLNVDNGHVQKSDQAGWGPTDFCFESKFCLWHQQGDGGDPSNISYLNVASGKSRTLWKPSFQDYLFFGKLIDWEAEEPGFIGTGPDGIYRISLDGTVQKIAAGDYYEYSISPDGKWLVAYNHNAPDVKSKGLLLLNNKLEVVQNLGDQKIKNLVWRPDSSGLFFTTKDLYHVSIPDGKLRLVENDTNVSLGESDYRWIP
jgi:hypothetical protein